MKFIMARLVSYKKTKKENSYISFANDLSNVSNESLFTANNSTSTATSNFKLISKRRHPDSKASTSLTMSKKYKTRHLICTIFGCILCERVWNKLCCCSSKCKCRWCTNCLNHCDQNGSDVNDLHNCEYNNVELYTRRTKYDISSTDGYKMNSTVEGISLSLTMNEDNRRGFNRGSCSNDIVGRRIDDGGGDNGDGIVGNYNGIRHFNANVNNTKNGDGGRVTAASSTSINCSDCKTNNNSKNNSLNKGKKSLWQWDDSIKSNSDKFLEAIEYNEIDDGKKSWRKGLRVPKIRLPAFRFKGDLFGLLYLIFLCSCRFVV